MSRTILGLSAAALILGASAVAIAQSGGDVRSNDRKIEKTLDHQKLTPIRPIRRVGPDDWPMGDPDKRADNLNKPKETTGQAPVASKDEPKQDQAKQPPAEPSKQDQARQDAPKPNQPPAQNNAQQQQPAPAAQHPQQAQSGNQQQNPQSQQSNADQKQDNFASIRLGTDAQGRVALNEAQEKQSLSALRTQRLRPAEASVKVGAVAPPDVRLGAVSADIVAVLPQFRGYSFFATRDEVVIVEPTDKKIVAVVPISGSQVASQPERERNTERSAERTNERVERSASRSSTGVSSRRESKRETIGAGIPSEEEILNAPVTGSSGRAQTRVEPDDGDAVVIERRPHRHRVFGIFRF